MRLALPCAAALSLVAAVAALPATGQAPVTPQPGCAGLSFADDSGDAVRDSAGLGTGPPASANLDLTGGWFGYDGDVATANVRIADLNAAPPTGAATISWALRYAVDAKERFVSATTDGSVVRYVAGTYDEGRYTEEPGSEVKGTLFTGMGGVVRIELPRTHSQPEVELLGASAESWVGTRVGSGRQTADVAPDVGAGERYVVGRCVDGSATAPGPTTSTDPPRTTASTTLPLRSVSSIGSAGRANKRRSLGFKIRATRSITTLKAHLVEPGGRTVAAGGLRRVNGLATLKVTLRRGRRLRPVEYILRATGTVSGKRRKVSLRVRATA